LTDAGQEWPHVLGYTAECGMETRTYDEN